MIRLKEAAQFCLLCSLITLVMVIFSHSTACAQRDVEVDVRIPKFSVRLNDTPISPVVNNYPLIVYKDITYFPMTWHYSRFLGLQTSWDQKTGLAISKSSPSADYVPYDTYINDVTRSYKAHIAAFSISINGKAILNQQEPYPLLVFRDITYFPLTWRFAVTEFGWQHYSYTPAGGLQIRSHAGASIRDDERVIGMVNETAFSKEYEFSMWGTLADERTQVSMTGIMQNRFDHTTRSLFSKVQPSKPLPFSGNMAISWWERQYGFAELTPQGLAYSYIGESNKALVTMFSNDALARINAFQIIGEMRKAVTSVERISVEQDSATRYRITFCPDSEWARRTVDVHIDWTQNLVKEISIEDVADYSLPDRNGRYRINLRITHAKRW